MVWRMVRVSGIGMCSDRVYTRHLWGSKRVRWTKEKFLYYTNLRSLTDEQMFSGVLVVGVFG